MRHVLFAAAAAAFLLPVGPAIAQETQAPAEAGEQDLQGLYEDFQAVYSERDWALARERGEALMAHRDWRTVQPGYQASVRFQMAIAYSFTDPARSIELLNAAEADFHDPNRVVLVRALVANEMEDWTAAATDLNRLARTDREIFAEIEMRTLWSVANGLRDVGEDDARRALLEDVVEHYAAEDPYDSTDYFRLELAREYARDGQARRALLTARGIEHTNALLPLHYEGVFADVWRLNDFDTVADIEAAREREIARLEETLERDPDNLNGAVYMLQALSADGRYDEAQAFASDVYDRLRATPDAFLATADRENWFLNEWAYVYFAQGDWQAGEARMREAANLSETGQINVSQVINLSDSQLRRGGFQDALDTLADFDPANASDVGDMFAWGNQACAHYGLGNREEADAIVARMDAQWDTNPAALQEALACQGDTDAGAALFVRRLEDEQHRSGALKAVQIRQPMYPEEIYGPHHQWRAELRRVHSRPEVRAAIEAHGRIVELPIYETYWGDV